MHRYCNVSEQKCIITKRIAKFYEKIVDSKDVTRYNSNINTYSYMISRNKKGDNDMKYTGLSTQKNHMMCCCCCQAVCMSTVYFSYALCTR